MLRKATRTQIVTRYLDTVLYLFPVGQHKLHTVHIHPSVPIHPAIPYLLLNRHSSHHPNIHTIY